MNQITADERAALLALGERFGVLQGVAPELLEATAARGGLVRYDAGAVLLEPAEVNRSFFIVVRGGLRVHLRGLSEPALTVLGPNECAGEVSLFDKQPPSAFVVADMPSLVLELTEDALWELVDACPQVARNLLYLLARRVRANTSVITDSVDASKRYARTAMTDGLTGIPNRRWLDETFPRELERCREATQSVCLMMIDADHFKAYNDIYGHQAGDRALQQIARTLQERLRPRDLLARYGGEEFALMLPDVELERAQAIGERIRVLVAAATQTPDDPDRAPITVSIGLAEAAPDEPLAELIRRADHMLYQAKREGRDRICVSRAAAGRRQPRCPRP